MNAPMTNIADLINANPVAAAMRDWMVNFRIWNDSEGGMEETAALTEAEAALVAALDADGQEQAEAEADAEDPR